jgi:hypothetical protein
MAWIDSWGNLRYVAAQAFIGLLHNKLYPDQSRRATVYTCFARKQARIMMGETGRSFVVSTTGLAGRRCLDEVSASAALLCAATAVGVFSRHVPAHATHA